MHQKYSSILFLLINKPNAQPANKTKFYLAFATLLVGIIAGIHAAIADTDRYIYKKPNDWGYCEKCVNPPNSVKSRPMPTPEASINPDKFGVPNGVTNKVITAPNPLKNKVPDPNAIKVKNERF